MAGKVRPTAFLLVIYKHIHPALGWRTIPFIASVFLLTASYRRKFRRADDDPARRETKDKLALLGALYHRLAKAIGAERAREVTTDLVRDVAVIEQRVWYIPKPEQPRSWDLLHSAHEYQMANGLIRFNEKTDIVKQPDVYRYHTTRCVFHEAFSDMGAPWLTEPFCYSDEVVFNEYLPGEFKFHRGPLAANTIARGAKQCEFIFERTKAN